MLLSLLVWLVCLVLLKPISILCSQQLLVPGCLSGHSPAALALHGAPPFFLPRDPVLAASMLEAVQSAPSTTQDRDDGTSLHLERSIVRHANSAAPRQSSAATLPLALPLASCRSTPVYFGNLDLSPWPRSGVAIAHVDSGRTKPERNGRPRRRCRRELAGR